MADGWRNRFRAPVYALVISFALAFILGAALQDRTPNDQRIQFMIVGLSGSSEPAKELKDLHVRVETAVASKRLNEGPLNQSGEFTLPTPNEGIRICTKLPESQFVSARAREPNGDSCWVRPAPGEDLMITLLRLEG